ncbi:MAG: DUF4340 domain-containing protein [Syntrophobacteraceae bacterium]|jgi:cbb3-type cytochrome oxidase subunit 3
MKWRTTAVYFLVLLLIGGIYLLLDTKKKEAAREEKESRRVFAFDAGAVKEIGIRSGETNAIRLEKGEKWRISEPIASDVDSGEFARFFSALQHIEQERKIGKPSDNLEAFGLNKPSLVVRLLAGSDWLELRIGGKNPAQTSRYAQAGEGGDVFMMSSATYDALNLSLRDLRRKDLFTWQPDQVSALDVKWRNGDGFSLDRQGGAKQWKSASRPDFEIKARKVQNLLDGLHWLRAADFAEKDAMPSSVQVEVRLHLKDGQTSELKIADADQAKKTAIAACSEIEGPVLVASQILDSIPRSIVSLADRSLVSAEAADIREITWKTDNGGGNLVWMADNTWGEKEGSAAPKAVEKPWTVRSFLAYIENVEYIEAVEPGANLPEGAPNSVLFVDVFGKKNSLTWKGLSSENASPVTVWMQRDGAAREVKIKHEDAQRLNVSLAQMSAGASGKPSKAD